MEIPRVTSFLGYSAETSGANEKPKWGHFTARFIDEVQKDFEGKFLEWVAEAWDEAFAAVTDAAPEVAWFASWNALTNPYRKES